MTLESLWPCICIKLNLRIVDFNWHLICNCWRPVCLLLKLLQLLRLFVFFHWNYFLQFPLPHQWSMMTMTSHYHPWLVLFTWDPTSRWNVSPEEVTLYQYWSGPEMVVLSTPLTRWANFSANSCLNEEYKCFMFYRLSLIKQRFSPQFLC